MSVRSLWLSHVGCGEMKADRNDLLIQAYREGASYRTLSRTFGIGEGRIYVILSEAGVVLRERYGVKRPKAQTRIWCNQCERSVLTAEAEQCSSNWCKAKAVAA